MCVEETKAAAILKRFHTYIAAPTIALVSAEPPAKKRMGLSVRLRYEILDRDAHTCQGCGHSPPLVKLHVDHRYSQAGWREQFGEGSLESTQTIAGVEYRGVNDRKNLITLCADCNLGKGVKNGNPSALKAVA